MRKFIRFNLLDLARDLFSSFLRFCLLGIQWYKVTKLVNETTVPQLVTIQPFKCVAHIMKHATICTGEES